MKAKRNYAVYRGDEFLDIGTAKELAKKFGVKEVTIKYWCTPSNALRDKGNRFVAVKLEDD